jgi:hypothetical protein
MNDLGPIERDTFGEQLEFRVRIESKAHVSIVLLTALFEKNLESDLYNLLQINEVRK